LPSKKLLEKEAFRKSFTKMKLLEEKAFRKSFANEAFRRRSFTK